MDFGESSGDLSSSGRENGVALLDSERPHKKARFPWQLKGKHHLKNQTDQLTEGPAIAPTEPEPITPPDEIAIPFSDKIPIDSSSASLVNEVTVTPNTSKEPRCLAWQSSRAKAMNLKPPLPLETVISLAESMLLWSQNDGNDFASTKIKLDKILEQQSENAGPSKPLIQLPSPPRDARKLRRAEEKCIARWQATQTVKGCFDNTINRVLESWMSAPAPTEERFLALDFAQIINELPPNDDNVENEGILMAINAHGLQNVMGGVPMVGGIPAILPSEPLARILASDIPICEDSDSSICSEDLELAYKRGSCSSWSSNENITQNENRPEPYQYLDNKHSLPGEDYNDYEFMNAAVIQAIKSKGLMAAGTDFG